MELQKKEEKIIGLDTRIKALETELSKTQDALDYERRLAIERKKLNDVNFFVKDSNIENLELRLANKQDYQLTEIEKLKQQLSEVSAKNEELEYTVKLAKKKNHQLTVLENQEEEIKSLRQQLNEVFAEKQELIGKVGNLDEEIWALNIEKQMDSYKIADLEKEKAVLTDSMELLQGQQEHSTQSAYDINHLTTQNKALEANITSLNATKQTLEGTITKLENQNHVLKEKANYKAPTSIKETHTSATSADSKNMLKAVRRLKAQNMILQETVSSLQSTIQELKTKEIKNKP